MLRRDRALAKAESPTTPEHRRCTTSTRHRAPMRCTSATSRLHRPEQRRSSSSTSSPAVPCRAIGPTACTQAVEAKEGVPIQRENQTLASITFQNYFPHVRKAVRHDRHGRHRGLEFPRSTGWTWSSSRPTAHAAIDAATWSTDRRREIRGDHRHIAIASRGQPVLVGTVSIETPSCPPAPKAKAVPPGASTPSSTRKPDRRPGRSSGAVTIATNMAGRGTDIVLAATGRGGDRPESGNPSKRGRLPQLKADGRNATTKCWPGGLHIIGTERHESRRIDNQLRGRSGRQGDPGFLPLLPLDGR